MRSPAHFLRPDAGLAWPEQVVASRQKWALTLHDTPSKLAGEANDTGQLMLRGDPQVVLEDVPGRLHRAGHRSTPRAGSFSPPRLTRRAGLLWSVGWSSGTNGCRQRNGGLAWSGAMCACGQCGCWSARFQTSTRRRTAGSNAAKSRR